MRTVCLLLCAIVVSAAPQLRLSPAAVSARVTAGSNASPQTIQTVNTGDGRLSPSVSAPTVSWYTASVDSADNLEFSFNTAGLAAGIYTSEVTVSAPGAIDAPQVVTVTVQVGTDPASIDQYIAPGVIQGFPLKFSSASSNATTASSTWLSVVVNQVGTLQMYKVYSIQLAPPASMAPGAYTGTVVTNGNETIPVTMRLTTQPIAVPSTPQLNLQLAEGGPATTDPFLPPIKLTNSGMGTLQVTGASAAGLGLSAASDSAGRVVVTADPGSLPVGSYTGSVTIQCNAANCPLEVPVRLQIVPQAAPQIDYRGVMANSSSVGGFDVAPGGVLVAKGAQFSPQPPTFATGVPLPTSLGGAQVFVNGVAAPLFYSSAGQVAFQMPSATAVGQALVQVVRDGQPGNTVSVEVATLAPMTVAVTDAAYNPVTADHPVTAGNPLLLWMTGMGATTPSVPDGQPAPSAPLAQAPFAVEALFFDDGGVISKAIFVGLSPGSVGLYQVIVQVPADHPIGQGLVMLEFPNQTPMYSSVVGFWVQ
jgi:uncharacterized protein (TIGR03437 family)